MTRNELDKKDYVIVEIFKGKRGNFNVTLRWSAQDSFTEKIMTSDDFNDRPGIDVVRACLDHTLRIKLQSYVKDLCYELTGCKKHNATKGTGTQYDRVIELVHEGNLVNEIQEKAIDFCYGTTYVADKEQKKVDNLDDGLQNLAKSNPEEAKRVALAAIEKLKEMGIEM